MAHLYEVVTRSDSHGVGGIGIRTNYTKSFRMAKVWARHDLLNAKKLPKPIFNSSKDLPYPTPLHLIYKIEGYTYTISVTITKIY